MCLGDLRKNIIAILQGFSKGQEPDKLAGYEDDFAHLVFDNLEQSFPFKEFQFKSFCQPAKPSCPSTENINETTDCKMHEQKVLVSKETVGLKQPPSKTHYSEKRPERNFTMLS